MGWLDVVFEPRISEKAVPVYYWSGLDSTSGYKPGVIMMNPRYVALTILWAALSFSPLPALAVPVTYVIEGTFPLVRRQVGTTISFVNDQFISIQFTVTDPTERVFTQFNPNSGEFSISSAFVTAPIFGLLDLPVTNQNLTFFQFDNGSDEQFALQLTLSESMFSRTVAVLLASESGLDFIDDPNKPLPLKSDLSGLTLFNHGWLTPSEDGGGLTLADGSILTFGFDATGGTVRNLQTIPEPSAFTLCTIGLLSLVFVAWERKGR